MGKLREEMCSICRSVGSEFVKLGGKFYCAKAHGPITAETVPQTETPVETTEVEEQPEEVETTEIEENTEEEKEE